MSDEQRPTNVRVEYSVEATINLGNFQNIRPGYKISADVPDGVNPAVIRAKLQQVADAWLEADVARHAADAEL